MISMLIGLVGAAVGLVGWFGFQSLIALIIGTVLYFIETLMEWQTLNANAKKLDIIIFIIGCIASFFTSVPWYVGGMLALNIYSAITAVVGVVTMVLIFFK